MLAWTSRNETHHLPLQGLTLTAEAADIARLATSIHVSGIVAKSPESNEDDSGAALGESVDGVVRAS